MVILSSKKNTKIKYKNKKDSNQSNMPMWRNWQTHWIQNPAGNHVGSSPTIGTNDVSALTNKIDKYKNQNKTTNFKKCETNQRKNTKKVSHF